MIKAPYNNPYGIWEVTTEGDCEGRSTTKLGIYKGYIDDIAFALADKCYYCLCFHAVDPNNPKFDMTPKRQYVDIMLDITSGTWKMSKEVRVAELSSLLKDRPVSVSESQFYGCVKLETHKETVEKKKEKALAKLTSEERKLLGI